MFLIFLIIALVDALINCLWPSDVLLPRGMLWPPWKNGSGGGVDGECTLGPISLRLLSGRFYWLI